MSDNEIVYAMDVYNNVCNGRFERVDAKIDGNTSVLMDIRAKVYNGYGTEIKNLKEEVSKVQKTSNEKIEDFKLENEKEHKELKEGQMGIQKSMRNLIITIVVAAVTVGGGIIAALLTGFFGLLQKLVQ